MIDMWWTRRQDNEPTNKYLARVLKEAGLDDMATRALAYHFDDFLAPSEIDNGDNMIRLHEELLDASTKSTRDGRLRIREIANAVTSGEFDATQDESEAWSNSAEGKAAERQYGALARHILGEMRVKGSGK